MPGNQSKPWSRATVVFRIIANHLRNAVCWIGRAGSTVPITGNAPEPATDSASLSKSASLIRGAGSPYQEQVLRFEAMLNRCVFHGHGAAPHSEPSCTCAPLVALPFFEEFFVCWCRLGFF